MIRKSGREVSNVHSLHGTNENAATIAVGWCLEQSPTFLKCFLRSAIGIENYDADKISIELQKGEEKRRTDMEIRCGTDFHIIVESKKGWEIPSEDQLRTYARRFGDETKLKIMLSLSAVSKNYAEGRLPELDKTIQIKPCSWGDVLKMAESSQSKASDRKEKMQLEELRNHLKGYADMSDARDNMVWVVSLSSDKIIEGSGYTWIDVVEKDNSYFHPVRNHYTVIPPNYIGFRYDGKLQSVHHIKGSEVVRNIQEVNSNWLKTDEDHFVYELGSAMRPAKTIRSGPIMARHVGCMIDTLLSGEFNTILEAGNETQRRLGEAGDS